MRKKQSQNTAKGDSPWIEHRAGNVAVILSVPHGGLEKPPESLDRTSGCLEGDDNSLALANAVYERFVDLCNQSGREIHGGAVDAGPLKPHFVASLLDRIKLDPNRPQHTATHEDCALSLCAHSTYHGLIKNAIRKELQTSPTVFLFDIHGQSHRPHTCELGYYVKTPDLRTSASEWVPGTALNSSLRTLFLRKSPPMSMEEFGEWVRGRHSLGALLESRGCLSLPSPSNQEPGNIETYFWGAHTVMTYGQVDGCVAVQIETPRHWRANESAWRDYGGRLAECLHEYMARTRAVIAV